MEIIGLELVTSSFASLDLDFYSRNMELGSVPSVGQCIFISFRPYSNSVNDGYYYPPPFFFLALETEALIVVRGKTKS